MRNILVQLVILPILFLSWPTSAQVPSPKDFLGFDVGEPRKLADMHQIIDYFHLLDAASDKIFVEEVGKTTESNPFIVAYITGSDHLINLEKYRAYQQRLADPRGMKDEELENILANGKTVVMINCSIHATEIGASQMALRLAYDLVTQNDRSTREILDNVILLLIPMHHPDGIQMVVDWYNKYLGTPYEGCGLPWLYHKYVGHDNNRDWYMFTQIESQLSLKIHNAWHPQIVLDMHQMGSRGARLFVPPYIDPFEPNVDPIIQANTSMLGTFIAAELTAEGKPGVMHSRDFDAWTPGRAYHHYHGGVRILTEAASARIATPISIRFDELSMDVRTPSVSLPLPWQGGEWTLKDIIDYDYSAAHAALIHAARFREHWLRNFYRIHQKAVNRTEPPFAFIIPNQQRDLAAMVKMLQTLQMGLVEIHRAKADFTADGQKFAAGSYIIYLAQPYGGYARALLEPQRYPALFASQNGPLKPPYDVVAHQLPLLMGVHVVSIEGPFQVASEQVDRIPPATGAMEPCTNAFGYAWDERSNDDIILVNRLLRNHHRVYWAAEPFEIKGKIYPSGTFLTVCTDQLLEKLPHLISDLAVQLNAVPLKPMIRLYELTSARLGIYQSWTAPIDEGWTRWVLEQFKFPYQRVSDHDIRNGQLNQQLDVIILPSMSDEAIVRGNSKQDMPAEYCGGIGEPGVSHLRTFLQQGGTLIVMNRSAEFAIKRFHLGIKNLVSTIDRTDFFIPGSILKVSVNNQHPIGYGFEPETAIFFWRSPVFEGKQGISVIKYAVKNPLLSGWLTGEEYLTNHSALMDVSWGKGRIILIGFPALFRGQAHGTFRFLFNSILYATAKSSDVASEEKLGR